MPEQITLTTQLVNQILAYLGGQPYQAVAGLIQGIQAEANAQVHNRPQFDEQLGAPKATIEEVSE